MEGAAAFRGPRDPDDSGSDHEYHAFGDSSSSGYHLQPSGDRAGLVNAGGDADGRGEPPSCGCCKRRTFKVTLGVVGLLIVAGAALAAYFVFGKSSKGGGSGGSVPYLPIYPINGTTCRPPADAFMLWNGLQKGKQANDRNVDAWYMPLDVNVNRTFRSSNGTHTFRIAAAWGDHHAVQLFANPEFLDEYDDKIRAWNPRAQNHSGAIDSCGWPQPNPRSLPNAQTHRAHRCFYEDFAEGWSDDTLTIALTKGCCSQYAVKLNNDTYYPSDPNAPPFAANLNVVADAVEYPPGNTVQKNVLRLTAINQDAGDSACTTCTQPPCPHCHKQVLTNGVVQTTQVFASSKLEVVAKVPYASGLVWAVWTYHHEEHIPWPSCTEFGCFKDSYRGVDPDFPPTSTWGSCCAGIDGCCNSGGPQSPRPANCPPLEQCPCCSGFLPSGPCANDTLCDPYWEDPQKKCAAEHDAPDPQFVNNATLNSWKLEVNHEIDIEMPASCYGTIVCTDAADDDMTFEQRKELKPGCINRRNTANLNNYIFTTPGGTGAAYSNMCVAAFLDAEDGGSGGGGGGGGGGNAKAETVTATAGLGTQGARVGEEEVGTAGGGIRGAASGARQGQTANTEAEADAAVAREAFEALKAEVDANGNMIGPDGVATGVPFNFLGDDKYHKYTIDWHTGGADCGDPSGKKSEPRVDFYIDDVYVGTNNVFVPTRASKFVIGAWPPTGGSSKHTWNNWADDWGGQPGDKQTYLMHTYVSEIRVTPHNEPRDIVYPDSTDQPDGCAPWYEYPDSCHKFWVPTATRPPVVKRPARGHLFTSECNRTNDAGLDFV